MRGREEKWQPVWMERIKIIQEKMEQREKKKRKNDMYM
jgi:hypothetical protein